MRLSHQEKAKLGDLYEQNRAWKRYVIWPISAFVVPIIICGRDFVHDLHNLGSDKEVLMVGFAAFLVGIAFAITIMQAILRKKLRERDEFILSLSEKHFPEDCPWKEEAAVLRQADELQREAKASGLLPQVTQPRQS